MNNTVSKLVLLALAGGFSLSSIAADDARCATITQSDPGWTDIAATNALSGVVLNALGYQQKSRTSLWRWPFRG